MKGKLSEVIKSRLNAMFEQFNDSVIARESGVPQSRVWRYRRNYDTISVIALIVFEDAGLLEETQEVRGLI